MERGDGSAAVAVAAVMASEAAPGVAMKQYHDEYHKEKSNHGA